MISPPSLKAALWLALAVVLVPATRGQGIPGLSPVPPTLSADQRAAFEQQRQSLEAQLQGFLAAANAFNGKKAEDQTDADYTSLMALRAACVAAAKVFNANLAAAVVAAQPHGDPMVVDGTKVPSGLKPETEAWLKGLSSVPGVYDRLRKGWQAYVVGDLDVASAWLQDALNHDPNNLDLRFVVNVMRKQQALAKNPAYNQAIDQGVAAFAAGNKEEKEAAVAKIHETRGVLVLPAPGDEELLINFEPSMKQILAGDALPPTWPGLNELLARHPELRPQLKAAWKARCLDMDKSELASVAKAAESLKVTAAKLGLPYGHIEETIAKDPVLKAKWEAAVKAAAATSNLDDMEHFVPFGSNGFQDTLDRLTAFASHQQNTNE